MNRRPADKRALSPHPIVGFVGPFGTGKTEIAINYSLAAQKAGLSVCVVDMDIVTPYFRVGDYRDQLVRAGLRVIAPSGALASFENPALLPEIEESLRNSELHVVLDVGGDPSGARLLGAYALAIAARRYDLWMVVNPFRPSAASPGQIAQQCRAIETATGLRVTGIVANPHLGRLTQRSHLEQGLRTIERIADRAGLPITFLAVERSQLDHAPETEVPVLPLELKVQLPWDDS